MACITKPDPELVPCCHQQPNGVAIITILAKYQYTNLPRMDDEGHPLLQAAHRLSGP